MLFVDGVLLNLFEKNLSKKKTRDVIDNSFYILVVNRNGVKFT